MTDAPLDKAAIPWMKKFLEGELTDGGPVRSSQVLGVFSAILNGPHGGPGVVELVGLGIAAQARCSRDVEEGKAHINPDATITDALPHVDNLIALGGIEDDLAAVWRRRRADESDDAEFETELKEIVERLQSWVV